MKQPWGAGGAPGAGGKEVPDECASSLAKSQPLTVNSQQTTHEFVIRNW